MVGGVDRTGNVGAHWDFCVWKLIGLCHGSRNLAQDMILLFWALCQHAGRQWLCTSSQKHEWNHFPSLRKHGWQNWFYFSGQDLVCHAASQSRDSFKSDMIVICSIPLFSLLYLIIWLCKQDHSIINPLPMSSFAFSKGVACLNCGTRGRGGRGSGGP
jgi:hypothetical protein